MENKQTEYALDIQDLAVEFRTHDRTVYAVNGLNLQIKQGQTLGLVGETGAGKTTTGLAILNLIQTPPGVITRGSIFLQGKDVLKMTTNALQQVRGKTASMIFQDPMTSLNPVLTVEMQIAEVIENHEHLGRKSAIEKAGEMLELVGISKERGKAYPHQFSGGMKQRVVIAMALACDPELLIADEPTTALDVTIQAQVLDLMKKLREKNNTSMLMITHDLGIVAEVCDCVSVVYAGKVVEHGTLEDVFDHTLHPYTKGLFNSLPNMNDRGAKLKPIKGLMPDPSNLPAGCAFADRCDYATARCFQSPPALVHRTPEHCVACHLYNEQNIQEGGVLHDV
ncbi:MAG: ABC transporter ATP-binding protein [Oscillospiraceae bacterium]|nr:ABC transporter ATP-binding protein [Oscillospiraceae bacterium]